MATVLNTLYPPSVQTYMPAFKYNEPATIYFSISSFNSIQDIEYIHLSLVDQRTNENMLGYKYEKGEGVNKTEAVGTVPVAIYKVWSSTDPVKHPNRKSLDEGDCPLYNSSTGLFSLQIPTSMLKTSPYFNNGQFYKVQLRFDKTDRKYFEDNKEDSGVITWVDRYVDEDGDIFYGPNWRNIDSLYIKKLSGYLSSNTQNFSEWSQICLIRPILIPTMELKGFSDGEEKVSSLSTDQTVPNFDRANIWLTGNVSFGTDSASNDSLAETRIEKETETLDHYTIHILDKHGKEVYTDNKVYTANKIANNSVNEINTLISLEGVDEIKEGDFYFAYIKAYTSNGYLLKNTYFRFSIASLGEAPDINIEFDKDNDNGILYLNMTYNLKPGFENGELIVRRTSDISNFKQWDLLRIFKVTASMFSGENANQTIFKIVDNTVGSMNWYRYSIQFRNEKGGLSKAIRTNQIAAGMSLIDKTQFTHFDYAIISRKDRQLALKFDYEVSSYKPVVNRAKADTLGGKYPKFTENAVLGYKQFSISGKISSQIDENELFLNKQESFGNYAYEKYYELDDALHGKYNEDNILIPDERLNYDDCYVHHGNWLEYNDWLWERKFREEAINWLNDGEPKLLRTTTEGNLCVMLTDINLTPEKTLGRRLYNFTATVYEVGDGNDLTTLDNLGIFDIIDETKISYDELIKQSEENKNGNSSKDEDSFITERRLFQLNNFSLYNQSWYWINNDNNNPYQLELNEYIRRIFNDKFQRTNYYIPPAEGHIWMTDIKIKFRNLPHIFVDSGDGNLVEVSSSNSENNNGSVNEPDDPKSNWDEKINDGIKFIGYKMDVKFSNGETQEIFINRKGYYQIPSNLIVTEIKFPQMQKGYDNQDIIDFDCMVYYHKKIDSSLINSGMSIVKELVAQQNGIFYPNKGVQNNIYKKHYYLNKTESSQGGSYTPEYFQYLENWKGVSVDVPPHTLINIKYYNDILQKPYETYQRYEIGESGFFNLFNSYPIYDLYFSGRKMFRVGREIGKYDGEISNDIKNDNGQIGTNGYEWWYDKEEFMREYEFFFEGVRYKSLEDLKNMENPKHQHVYCVEDATTHYIYWNGEFYLFLIDEKKFADEDSSEELDGLYLTWDDIDNENFLEGKTYIIDNIRYINYDNAWINYDELIEAFDIKNKTNVGIALIPTYALINYTGTIMRKYY